MPNQAPVDDADNEIVIRPVGISLKKRRKALKRFLRTTRYAAIEETSNSENPAES